MQAFKVFSLLIAVIAIFYFAIRWDFYVWRLQHPTAPTWVFWLTRDR